MGGISKRLSAAAVIALLVLGASSCGDGEEPASSGTTAAVPDGETAPTRGESGKGERDSGGEGASSGSGGALQGDSGGGAGQFRTEGGDNSVQNFGDEVGGAQFEQAAATLHGYLDARAAGDWQGACSYLAEETIEMLERFASQSSQLKGSGCGSILAAFSGGGSPAMLRDEATSADVGSLRAEGDRAFVLFHGLEGTAYVMPMTDQDGDWKLASVAATPLP